MHIYKRLDLLVASFLINTLGLAIPIYIIHSINRYLGNDNLDTLIFLTVTVIVATCLEHLIRKYRKFIILNINDKKFNTENLPENKNFKSDNKIEQELNYIKSLTKNYDFNMQISFLDVPYILLFSVVIYLLSPLIFFLYSLLAFVVLIISLYHRINQNKYFKKINQLNGEYTQYENKLKQNIINFRVNLVYKKILNSLNFKQREILNQKKILDSDNYNFETLNSFLLNILIIFVVMISLLEINKGDMQISSMIALNILVVRALLPVKLIPNIIFYQDKAKTISYNHRDRNKISKNKLSFKDLKPIKNIKLSNVTYLHHNASIPLFNQFSINFAQGTTTVISGENESGKSTLFNIICGALEPMHGKIQINGIEIDRQQKEKIYEITSVISQYPVFKDKTFLECLENSRDNIKPLKIEDILKKCNLSSFFSDKTDGVNYNLSENENLMSLGIKKRIALSQVLHKDSEVILFDEPTQGCDQRTCQVFYNFLNKKISEKKMVIIFSNDPLIIQGAHIVLELKKVVNQFI